jgi:hypothetical protein
MALDVQFQASRGRLLIQWQRDAAAGECEKWEHYMCGAANAHVVTLVHPGWGVIS